MSLQGVVADLDGRVAAMEKHFRAVQSAYDEARPQGVRKLFQSLALNRTLKSPSLPEERAAALLAQAEGAFHAGFALADSFRAHTPADEPLPAVAAAAAAGEA